MIVDSLTFLGGSLFGVRSGPTELLARMDETGIDRAIVCPLKPPGYHLAEANDAVATAVEARRDRLVGFARVDPWQGKAAVAELRRAVEKRGLRGLLLHPWEETYRVSDPVVDPVVSAAGDLGLPVIVAAGYPWLSEALQIGELARRHPGVTFVATNGGQLNVSGLGQTDAELALERCPNLALQTAGVYREDFIEGAVATFGAERVLFASGFPWLEPSLEVLRVQWAPALDETSRAAILGGNAARLLGDT